MDPEQLAEFKRANPALGDAKVGPNGKIISGMSWVSEFTDSDGQVYNCPEPCPRKVQRHRSAVLAFKATVRDRWVARSRSVRRPQQPRVRVGRTQRPRARRSTRRVTSTRAGPDDGPGEPPGPALRLAPPPKAIFSFAVLSPEQRGQAT